MKPSWIIPLNGVLNFYLIQLLAMAPVGMSIVLWYLGDRDFWPSEAQHFYTWLIILMNSSIVLNLADSIWYRRNFYQKLTKTVILLFATYMILVTYSAEYDRFSLMNTTTAPLIDTHLIDGKPYTGEPAWRSGDPADDNSDAMYFSVITWTSVGYGDIVPANAHARRLAMYEAINGYFVMAILMAYFVNLLQDAKRTGQTSQNLIDEDGVKQVTHPPQGLN